MTTRRTATSAASSSALGSPATTRRAGTSGSTAVGPDVPFSEMLTQGTLRRGGHERPSGAPCDDPRVRREVPGGSATNAVTLATYEAAADLYEARSRPGPGFANFLDRVASMVAAGGAVLEIGSGTGADAAALEDHGLRVRRTDAAGSFVSRLRARGLQADVLDILTGDPGGPWDLIWASAVFLHFTAAELTQVLDITAAAAPGGYLAFTVKEGDGADWSTAKLDRPRYFTYWRESALRELLNASPWRIVSMERREGLREPWLLCLCTNRD